VLLLLNRVSGIWFTEPIFSVIQYMSRRLFINTHCSFTHIYNKSNKKKLYAHGEMVNNQVITYNMTLGTVSHSLAIIITYYYTVKMQDNVPILQVWSEMILWGNYQEVVKHYNVVSFTTLTLSQVPKTIFW
jgi:hypothetical protein